MVFDQDLALSSAHGAGQATINPPAHWHVVNQAFEEGGA